MSTPNFGDAETVAGLLAERANRQREEVRPFKANVTAVTDGLLSIQRAIADDDEDAGYPVIKSGIPAVGDEVVCLALGGAPVVLGILTDAETDVPEIGQVYVMMSSASAATASSNTSNSTWATLRSTTFTSSAIPDGTYSLDIDWSATFSDSDSGSLNTRIIAGGQTGTSTTLSVTTARERIGYTGSFTGVVASGGLTVTIEYKRDSGTGTMTARNPRFLVFATRTGA